MLTFFNSIAFSKFLFLQYKLSNCLLEPFLESPMDSAFSITFSKVLSV